jgi:hypothetical protein
LAPKIREEGEEGKEGEAEEDEESEAAGEEEDGEKKKKMLNFDATKLVPAEVIDLDNGTYEVKYKNDTEEELAIWVYF